MNSQTTGAAVGGASSTLTLGEREVTIERPTSLKASRALAMLRALSKSSGPLQSELAEFRIRYEAENFVELDPVQARVRYPPQPIVQDGEVLLDENGAPVLIPSPVDSIPAHEWEASGGKLRRPASPAPWEIALALLDTGVEAAEELVYRFLALFTIPNAELKAARSAGTLDEVVRQAADALLDDSYADELFELAVVVNETLDQHFRRKAVAIGADRVGKLLSLIPREFRPSSSTTTSSSTPTSSTNGTTPESSRPSSSTDSPVSTDGDPTTSSEPLTTSSSTSEASSTSTPSDAGAPASEPAPAPLTEA